MFLFLLDKYLGVGLLGLMVSVYVSLETAKFFSKVTGGVNAWPRVKPFSPGPCPSGLMSSFGEQEQNNECPNDSGPTGWPVGGEKEQPPAWGQSSPHLSIFSPVTAPGWRGCWHPSTPLVDAKTH